VRVTFSLNGRAVSSDVSGARRLLDVLREDLAFTGTKEGCGEGECGACSVLIDGEVVNSCLVAAGQVEGCDVVTVEGLANGAELSAELLAIYGVAGAGPCLFRVIDEPQILTASELGELGYPDVRGQVYFCLRIEPISSVPAWLTANECEAIADVLRNGRAKGAPIVTDWLTLSQLAAR